MARITFPLVLLAIFASVAPGRAGPACAAKKWSSVEECVAKCSGRWGWAGHAMGTDPWGAVVKPFAEGTSADQLLLDACSSTGDSSSGSASSTGAVVNIQPTPSLESVEPTVVSTTVSSSSLDTTSSSTLSSSSASSVVTSRSLSSLHSSSTLSSSASSSIVSSASRSRSVLATVSVSTSADSNGAVVRTSSSSSSEAPKTSSAPPPPPSSSSSQPPPPPPTTTSKPPPPPPTTTSQPPPPPPSTTSTPPPPPPTSSTTKAPAPTSTQGTSGSRTGGVSAADQQAYLNAHNSVRAKHGAAPLSWSTELEDAARKWASKCVFEHSGGQLGPFGENLAAGTGSGYGIAEAVKGWTDEVADFNSNNPQPSHFTQVVWKGTNQVGCAVAECDGIFDASFGKAHYHVCEYSKQGNIIGAFAQNVQA